MLGLTKAKLNIQLFSTSGAGTIDGTLSDTPLNVTGTSNACIMYTPINQISQNSPDHRDMLHTFELSRRIAEGTIIGLGHVGSLLLYQKMHSDQQSQPASITESVCVPVGSSVDDHEENVPLIAVDGSMCEAIITKISYPFLSLPITQIATAVRSAQ